jgi:exosome complex component RRP45
MDRPISNNERETTLTLLESGKRWDGRRCDHYRRVIMCPHRGECEVTLVEEGQFGRETQRKCTKVFCHVACEIGRPSPDRPNEGGVTVHVVFSPMPNIVFDSYRWSEACTQMSQTLEKVLRESRLIETESLCIIAGDKVSLFKRSKSPV